MGTRISAIIVTCFFTFLLQAQMESYKDYRNFPIVFSIQFHSLSMPFKDLKSNFSNVGFGIGTEVSLNGKEDWAQQFTAVWYHNKEAGDGLFFYSQGAWRPTIVSDAFVEVKVGLGYLYSFRPVVSLKHVNGNWESSGHKGKGMLALPIGASIGYNSYSTNTNYSPFASYQFIFLHGYNKSIPLISETLIQAGIRIHHKFESQ